MIAHLRGKLAQKDSARVIVDVHGVGYEVFIPLTTFSALPDIGSDVSIDIHTHVREDIIALYGFSTRRERAIFEKLMTISGIGPKLAVTILSGGSVEDLVTAIKRGDLPRLTAIPGVGKKTAERIVLELKDKLGEFAEAPRAPPSKWMCSQPWRISATTAPCPRRPWPARRTVTEPLLSMCCSNVRSRF